MLASNDQIEFITYTETSLDGRSYKVIYRNTAKQDLTTFKVPNGQTFVLGDNRSNTSDSRDFGFVPLVDTVGRAEQIWLSSDIKRIGTTL